MLLEDACATSSAEYWKQSLVFNRTQCWGVSTTAGTFAAARSVRS